MTPKGRYATKPTSGDPRETEAWALTEAARRLIDGARAQDGGQALRAALLLNQKLWTIFQAEISEEACPLPAELRQNLAALSILVDRETMSRLADLDGSKLDTLIEINRAVAGGLAPRAPTQAAASEQPTPAASPDGVRLSI